MKAGGGFDPWQAFKRDFIKIPGAVLKNPDLTPGAKLAYGRLLLFNGADGRCYPSADTLAGELGVTPRQAKRYLAELKAGGFIEAKRRGRGKSNFYTFLEHPSFGVGALEGTYMSPQEQSEVTSTSLPEGTYMSPKKNQGKDSSSTPKEIQSLEPSRSSKEPLKSPEPEKAEPPLRGDDDETLEPPERLRRWIDRTHPRPAENPEEQTAADIVGLVQRDLTEKGHAPDADFVTFVRSRATGKAKNRTGLYRKLAKEYATARQAKAAEQRFAIVQAIKNGVKETHVHKCQKCGSTDPEGGMVLTESGFGFCECATEAYRETHGARVAADNARLADLRAKRGAAA